MTLFRHARRAVPVLVAAGATALVFTGGYMGYRFITMSSRFAMQVIEVRGNHHMPTAEVLGVLGVSPGDNIFRVELASLTRTLESQPWIARATVRRQLPATLIVEVEERQPAAMVELDGLYLADARGHVFKRAEIERGDGDGLPVITGLDRTGYAEEPEAVQADIREVLAAIALYQSSDRPLLGETNLDPRRGLTFLTYEGGVAVRVGQGDAATLRDRLRAFDIAWNGLSEPERASARIVYADASTRTDRVTIGFVASE